MPVSNSRGLPLSLPGCIKWLFPAWLTIIPLCPNSQFLAYKVGLMIPIYENMLPSSWGVTLFSVAVSVWNKCVFLDSIFICLPRFVYLMLFSAFHRSHSIHVWAVATWALTHWRFAQHFYLEFSRLVGLYFSLHICSSVPLLLSEFISWVINSYCSVTCPEHCCPSWLLLTSKNMWSVSIFNRS